MANGLLLRRLLVAFALLLAMGAVATQGATSSAPSLPNLSPPSLTLPAAIADPDLARADYIENCGGCHGVQGLSAPAALPQLRDRVGWFLCTPAARAYLLRLPNVAHSRIADNQELADLMNFVVFGLGGQSTPVGTRPFTAQEVAYERQFVLASASLRQERARHVEEAIRRCRAPASMRLLYPGEIVPKQGL